MCYFATLGVPVAQIASISGHSINYVQDVLDHYLPSNPNFSIMAVAQVLEHSLKLDSPAPFVAHATALPSHSQGGG